MEYKEYVVGETKRGELIMRFTYTTLGEALEAQHRDFKKYGHRWQVLGIQNFTNEVKLLANRLPVNF